MKTEELIRALTADVAKPVTPIRSTLLRALALGALLSTALFLLILRPRPDVGQALLTVAFDFKLLVALGVAAASVGFLAQAAIPAPAVQRRWVLLLPPLLLAAAVLVELATAPRDSWTQRLVGHNAVHCLSLIPILSLPCGVCLIFGLRRAAPRNPPVAGAAAGLLAGGIGAGLYALTCPDDSPLFVATWYSTAIAAVVGICALAGHRWLRW